MWCVFFVCHSCNQLNPYAVFIPGYSFRKTIQGRGDMEVKASRLDHIMKGLPTKPNGTTASGDSIEITRTST